VTTFNEKFNILEDPKEIVIDFRESRVVDMSAIEALNQLTERYNKVEKKVHLKNLNPDCRELLRKAETLIDINIIENNTEEEQLYQAKEAELS